MNDNQQPTKRAKQMQEYKYRVMYQVPQETMPSKSHEFTAESIEAAVNRWHREFTFNVVSVECTGPASTPERGDGSLQEFQIYWDNGSGQKKVQRVVSVSFNEAIATFNSYKGKDVRIEKVEHIGPFQAQKAEEPPVKPDVALAVDLLVRMNGARLGDQQRKRVPKRILEAYDKHTENT